MQSLDPSIVNSKSADTDERLLVLRAQQGDRVALSRLIDRYDKRLLYFIRRLVGDSDEVLDILQAVWLTVHRKLRGLKSPDAFRVWLYRVTHDRAVSYLRKRSRGPLLVDQLDSFAESEDPNADELEFENAELVHTAMQELSIDHRRVLVLKFIEDMSVEEIAEVVDCKPGTVKSRLHYAKLALRKRIEERLNG